MGTQTTICPKQITDVSQMHSRPGRRCYTLSTNNIPWYRLASEVHEDGRWYGWISTHKKSSTTSIVNPFFPMSNTARGAVKNELGTFTHNTCSGRNTPIVVHEFMNFEEAMAYFEPIVRDRSPGYVWAQERT